MHSRLRRKSDRNPESLTHSSPSSVTLAGALARLRQRQVQRGSRSDACTARRASEPSATLISFQRHTRKGSGSVATTRSSPQKLDEAMLRRCVHSSAMIGTLTHLDTLISVTRHTRKSAALWLGCHSAKLDEAMRAQLAMIGTLTHSSPRHISVKRHTRKRGRCWLTVATTRQARQKSSTRRCSCTARQARRGDACTAPR